MATESAPQANDADPGTLAPVDRGLYALFSRRADSQRHERDRHRYRATNLGVSFEVYLARVYGCAWLAALLALAGTAGLALLLPPSVVDSVAAFLQSGLPVVDRLSLPVVPPVLFGVAVGAGVGLAVRWATVRLGGRYLYWRAQARRGDIETTLPAAVRYLRVLSSGSSDQREMLRRIATQDVYGETGVAFRRALNEATLTGSLEAGLERVARDTPSRDLLAPFLLKYREHASQGTDSLSEFLRMEGRLLSHRQARTHERVSGYLELLAELFVVLLVLPALLVLIVTVMSVLAPGLSQTVPTPLGPLTMRAVVVYGSAAFVVVVGLAAAATVETVRPTQQATPTYEAPEDVTAVLATAPINPASAAVVTAAVVPLIALALWTLGYAPLNVALLGYVAFGLPVGLVAVRRARRDDAKDREIRDFVHAVSGHVALGRPFSEAVERVASEVDHGALQGDVDTLAFTLSLTTDAGDGEGDVRAAALDRFVEDVGTPLARQTIGLVVGALDAGSDTEQVFESLETEIGRLYHERKELRSTLLVYVAVGWTTGLLVLGIVLAVNAFVLDGFAQLSTVSGATGRTAMALDPDAIDPERARRRFYAVTQGTMLACGWFAGVASRGRYEALLHSSILVAITYVVFAGAGMV